MGFLAWVLFSYYYFFSFSNLLFKLFHSCFCSWRARGNIPFLTAKPALPAHREPWQPCNLCPHPLPAAPAPPPTPPISSPTSFFPPTEEAAAKDVQSMESVSRNQVKAAVFAPHPTLQASSLISLNPFLLPRGLSKHRRLKSLWSPCMVSHTKWMLPRVKSHSYRTFLKPTLLSRRHRTEITLLLT